MQAIGVGGGHANFLHAPEQSRAGGLFLRRIHRARFRKGGAAELLQPHMVRTDLTATWAIDRDGVLYHGRRCAPPSVCGQCFPASIPDAPCPPAVYVPAMTNAFAVVLDSACMRRAAAEGVPETVIAAIYLLREYNVDEIAASLGRTSSGTSSGWLTAVQAAIRP